MTRRLPWMGMTALACALVAWGCSGTSRDQQQATAGKSGAGARLSPDPASTASRINVVLADRRLNPANCRFEWRRNGSVIAGAGTNSLDPSDFAKGDRISVAVHAPDPVSGTPRTSNAEVRVVNTAPRVTRAALSMTTSPGGVQLQANVDGADPDGDHLTYAYRWFRNGGMIEGAASAILPATAFSRGDRVAVEVVARDDESQSPAMRSEPFAVENRPPQFSSQPYAPGSKDVAFRYQAVASDPDGDPLRYELVKGPAGMTVDAQGSVSWQLPSAELRRGDFPVRIRATDSKGGEAVQDFTIHLDTQKASL